MVADGERKMIDDVGISSRLFTERNKMCFSASITGADPLSSVGSFYLPCMGERRPSSRLLSSHHRRRVRQVGRARRGEGRGRNFARRASIMLGQNVSGPLPKHVAPLPRVDTMRPRLPRHQNDARRGVISVGIEMQESALPWARYCLSASAPRQTSRAARAM